MRRKSNKKGSRRVKRKTKLALVVDPKTRKPSIVTTLIFAFLAASALGVGSYMVYEVIVNGHCWSWF